MVIDALHVVIPQKLGFLITTSVGTSNALKYLFKQSVSVEYGWNWYMISFNSEVWYSGFVFSTL
jgi:hypothetical protein